jgi:hypothetical protein
MLHTPQQLKAKNAALEAQIRKDAELREKQVPDDNKVDSQELKDKDKGGGAKNTGVIEGRESPLVRAASPYCVSGVSYAASPHNANGVAYAASPHNAHMNQSPGAKIIAQEKDCSGHTAYAYTFSHLLYLCHSRSFSRIFHLCHTLYYCALLQIFLCQ